MKGADVYEWHRINFQIRTEVSGLQSNITTVTGADNSLKRSICHHRSLLRYFRDLWLKKAMD
jgi:hypothetical protein